MNNFESNSSQLWRELKTIQEKISNMSDPNVTINTNSTIILRIEEIRLLQEYFNHREAELRSLTLPIIADGEIFFENLHQ